MDWDNLRFFLELARAGTLQGAARGLGVDHTTVARRIRALENTHGTALFARESDGHRLTEAGRNLLPQVEAMETAVRGVAYSALATDDALSGVVRIGATEGFGAAILAPQLARFALGRPRLLIDLVAVPRQVHLSRREADIVISLERPARGPVIVSRLTDYKLHLYAARSYLKGRGAIRTREALAGHTFISYVDDLLFSKELLFLEELHRPENFALRSTSILAQCAATATGGGIAVLPAFLADRDKRLVRVLRGEASFTRTFWISMPVENKQVARMKAVWDFLRATVEAQQDVLLAP